MTPSAFPKTPSALPKTPSTETHFAFMPYTFDSSTLTITEIQTMEETLQIPLKVDGKWISGLSLDPGLVLSSVKTLILPEKLKIFEATQKNFPSLQKLFRQRRYQPNHLTEAEDLAVYEDENTLLACLSSQKRFVIPSFVKCIGGFAFKDSPVEEILCECRYLEEVDPHAFQGSARLKKNYLLVHDCDLLYLAKDVEELRLLDEVRQIGEHAFMNHLPKKLAVHHASCLQDDRGISGGIRQTRYQEVFVQDTEELLPFASYCNTNSFSFPKEDPRYTCVDGVVFSKDKSQLVLYPPCKPDKEYFVPEGTQSLLREAFQTTQCVESLHLPSSVRLCGERCFAEMPILCSVHLPDQLEVISSQLFTNCKNLKSVSFPKGLRSIEEKAFLSTALEEITLPEGVTSVGEEAFYDSFLKKVHLPSTLQQVGKSSFIPAQEVWAYEGTAKGLFAALHESPYHSHFVPERHSPSRLIHVLGGQKEKILFFPKDFSQPCSDLHLERIWDGDSIDYEPLAENFPHLTFPNKAEVALTLVLQGQDPSGEYHQYLHRVAKSAGEHFLSFEDETLFFLFAKEISFTPKARQDLLDLCNQRGRLREAAYLLDQKGGKTPSRSFSL